MLDWNDYLRVFTGLMAVVGPLGVVPLFLSFTENVKSQRNRIARTSGVAVGLILTVSVFAGTSILNLFNISIDGFRIAGGILLLGIAFDMLHAKADSTKHTPEEEEEALSSTSNAVAVVPLALPLLAGPGAISAVILYSQQSEVVAHKLTLTAICWVTALSVWICFHLAPQIDQRLSQTSMNIVSRVMGLILAAMSVEFIVDGIRNLLPGLA